MALSIPIIIGLGYLGSQFNSEGKRSRAVKTIRSKVNPEDKPSGNNVYHSNRSQEVDLTVRKEADKMFRDSMDPCNTNIIPAFYNTLYDLQCGPLGINNQQQLSKETVLPQELEKMDPNTLDSKILHGPMWQNPVTESFRNLPTENELSENTEVSNLTGLPLDRRHNNMVPYFGGSVKQNVNYGIHEQKLEMFTGVGDIVQRNKEEVGPFFELQRENIFGTPNLPDELRNERYFQSNLKTNILPTPQVRVHAPKPEEMARPRYRTIDELRPTSDPQVTYEGRPSGAPQGAPERGMQAPVKKNRAPKFHWTGQDRFGPAGARLPARKMDENFSNMKPQNREDSEEQFFGPAGAVSAKGPRAGICKPDYTVTSLIKATQPNQFNGTRAPQGTDVIARGRNDYFGHVDVF